MNEDEVKYVVKRTSEDIESAKASVGMLEDGTYPEYIDLGPVSKEIIADTVPPIHIEYSSEDDCNLGGSMKEDMQNWEKEFVYSNSSSQTKITGILIIYSYSHRSSLGQLFHSLEGNLPDNVALRMVHIENGEERVEYIKF